MKVAFEQDLIELLAALEHEQWAHWMEYMLDNINENNILRWKDLMETDYEELTEEEKESDRDWARRALEIFKDNYFEEEEDE